MEAAYGDFGDEDEDESHVPAPGGADPPSGEWYDPGPALSAVRAIRDHLAEHPADLGFRPDASRAHWPADLMDELSDCVSALEGAAARGHQFRFLIVP